MRVIYSRAGRNLIIELITSSASVVAASACAVLPCASIHWLGTGSAHGHSGSTVPIRVAIISGPARKDVREVSLRGCANAPLASFGHKSLTSAFADAAGSETEWTEIAPTYWRAS